LQLSIWLAVKMVPLKLTVPLPSLPIALPLPPVGMPAASLPEKVALVITVLPPPLRIAAPFAAPRIKPLIELLPWNVEFVTTNVPLL
jgi:hypothetical protein